MAYDAIANRISKIQSGESNPTAGLISMGFKGATGTGLSQEDKTRQDALRKRESGLRDSE